MSTTESTPESLKSFGIDYKDRDGLSEREVQKIKDDVTDLLLSQNLTKFSLEVEGSELWRDLDAVEQVDRDEPAGDEQDAEQEGDDEADRDPVESDADDVTVTVHGDTPAGDDGAKPTPSDEYLDALDDGEDVDPEDMVPHKITPKSAKWKVLGLLARTQGRLQQGQIHAMLDGTEWELKRTHVSNALYELKSDGLIEDEDKSRNNAYSVTQLGIDYCTVKNLTTAGHDLAVADRITNTTTDDTDREGVAAD